MVVMAILIFETTRRDEDEADKHSAIFFKKDNR